MTPYTELDGIAAQTAQLHRIREIREQMGITPRHAARMLNVSLDELRRQEDPSSDLTISELQNWQDLLDGDVYDLIVDQEVPFPRAALSSHDVSSFLETATRMLDDSECPAVKRLAETLTNQLREIS